MSIDSFTTTEKTCLIGALLEIERKVFGNAEDKTFVEGGEDCVMSLSDREKAVLTVDKRSF